MHCVLHLLILIFITTEYHINCMKANEACEAPPKMTHTKSLKPALYLPGCKVRLCCEDGYVRQAGTSNLIHCTGTHWENLKGPTALICKLDPQPQNRASDTGCGVIKPCVPEYLYIPETTTHTVQQDPVESTPTATTTGFTSFTTSTRITRRTTGTGQKPETPTSTIFPILPSTWATVPDTESYRENVSTSVSLTDSTQPEFNSTSTIGVPSPVSHTAVSTVTLSSVGMIFAIALIGAAFLCYRQRRSQPLASQQPDLEMSTSSKYEPVPVLHSVPAAT